jgi:ABC-type nitrate/sulfonate/bicarbonate transport system substrate-binding protein
MPRSLLLALSLIIGLGLSACATPPAAPAPDRTPPGGGAAQQAGHGSVASTAAPTSPPAAEQSSSASASRQPLSPRVAVRYGELGQASDAGFYLALDRGYFAEEGLDVEPVSLGSGGRMVPALGAGQVEVGGGGMSAALINAIARDVPLKLIADKGSLRQGFGYESLVVRKDLFDSGAVKTIPDLKGRKIALNSTTSMDFFLLNGALESAGVRLEDTVLEEISFSDMIAALANGSVDAAISLEPIATAIVHQGVGIKLLTLDAVMPNAQVGVIMYAPHFMRDQPEAARRFAIAYLRGMRDHNRAFTTGERRDEAIQTLIKHTSIKDPLVFDTMVPPGLNPDGYLNLDGVMAAQEFWRRSNLLQATLPAEAVVDHSYLDYAISVLGRYQ